MSDVWRAVITVGQWQGALTRKLTEGALVFLHNRLIRSGFAVALPCGCASYTALARNKCTARVVSNGHEFAS